jgi:hypothetical protein
MVLISVSGWVDPKAIVQLEALGKLKKKNPPHYVINIIKNVTLTAENHLVWY